MINTLYEFLEFDQQEILELVVIIFNELLESFSSLYYSDLYSSLYAEIFINAKYYLI